MIPELGFLGALFVLVCIALILLSEDERLEDMSNHRAVNGMADRSKKRKTGRAHKYTRAGIQ